MSISTARIPRSRECCTDSSVFSSTMAAAPRWPIRMGRSPVKKLSTRLSNGARGRPVYKKVSVALGTKRKGGDHRGPLSLDSVQAHRCPDLALVFPELGKHEDEWLGFRPSLPDFLPVIGPSKNHKNLFYSFGHHHLGWTLGAISGKIIAGMIAEEKTNLDLSPYNSLRFS